MSVTIITDVFELIGLDIKMFYGGPSEAVMHAIYRQNYGFSDLVIGRKHADAPYEDGSPIWGDFDAQEIFDELKGELHLTSVQHRLRRLLRVARPGRSHREPSRREALTVSGTRVREQLKAGERPDPRIMRPETADILIEAYRLGSHEDRRPARAQGQGVPGRDRARRRASALRLSGHEVIVERSAGEGSGLPDERCTRRPAPAWWTSRRHGRPSWW